MFLHELKQYRKSTIIWTISLIAVAVLFLSIYTSFTKDIAALQKLLASLPDVVKKAFGITLADLSITGFYSMILSYVILAGSIQAMIIGTSIVSKEEREKTAEFLLAKPVRRSQVLTAKLLAGLTILLITNAVFMGSIPILLNALVGQTIAFNTFLLLSLTLLFVQIFFLGLGFLVSVAAPKIRSVLSVSLSTVFAFYILGTLDSIIGSTTIRYFTPFKYYDLLYIAKHGSYEIGFVLLEAVLVIAAVVTSYYVYQNRDIRST
jgi:ABC-2 type transport system permease protein